MKIGIDARMINYSGIGVYIKNLIRELPNLSNNEYVLFGDSKKLENFNLPVIDTKLPIYGIKEQIFFPFKLSKQKLDLLHLPHYPIPLLYRGEIVVTIHDLIHLIYPEYLPSKAAWFYAKFMFSHAGRRAKKVIAVSENTKRDTVELLNIPAEKIKVIYNGIDERFKPINDKESIEKTKRKYGLSEKYILYAGLLKPHKNILRLIEAFPKLRRETQIKDKLVLVGNKEFPHYRAIKEKIKELDLENQILILGEVDSEDMTALYNGADVFVLPSLYEGFGLPPLEAMACGCPVITSNTSSLPEVVGDAGIMVDPCDMDGLAEAICKVLTDEGLRQEMIKKGLARAKLFSWEKTAKETLKIYKEVAKG